MENVPPGHRNVHEHVLGHCVAILQILLNFAIFYKNELQNVLLHVYELTLGILRSEPGLTFIFTFVVAEIGFKTKSQTKWFA